MPPESSSTRRRTIDAAVLGVLLVVVVALDGPINIRSARSAGRSGPGALGGIVGRSIPADDHRSAQASAATARNAERRTLSHDSEAYDDARSRLDDRFREYETSRYIVLSDAGPQWTLEQAQRLEQTHHQFQRLARRIGIEPLPLRHRLVCVLFADREDYRAFASTHDDVDGSWIAGYYAPRHDRVVFYDSASNPSVVEARARLAEMTGDLEDIDEQARSARRDGRRARAEALERHEQGYRDHVRQERDRVDAFANQVAIATTVHEAIHQLMFHAGVQSPRHRYPVWISEGLATAFETDDTSAAFGPDHEYEPRRAVFERLRQEGGLLDLRELVSMMRMPDTPEAVSAVYHQSYALVTWMSRFRRREMKSYLELMRAEEGPPIEAGRAVAIFEAAFGPIARVERSWLHHEKGVGSLFGDEGDRG